MNESVSRCQWVGSCPELISYHDSEWCQINHSDLYHFEMLTLEGAQAGLSWLTILKRREGYRTLFAHFDPELIVKFSDDYLNSILRDTRIIRNRLKVYSVRKNALSFLKIQDEFGSFDTYLWRFVGEEPIVKPQGSPMAVSSSLSDTISKDLKKRGMSFVGSTIIYSYLQAVGVVSDHDDDCFCARVVIND